MLRLSELFSTGATGISGSGAGIFLSPVWTAMITISLLLIMIYFIIRNEVEPVYDDTSLITLLIRIGVWGFLIESVILYLSYGAIERFEADKHKNKNKEQIVMGITNGNNGTGTIEPT